MKKHNVIEHNELIIDEKNQFDEKEDDEENKSNLTVNDFKGLNDSNFDLLKIIPSQLTEFLASTLLLYNHNKISNWIINKTTIVFNMDLLQAKVKDTSRLSDNTSIQLINPNQDVDLGKISRVNHKLLKISYVLNLVYRSYHEEVH